MPRKRHPELEGYQSEPLYIFELKSHSQRKKRRHRLFWTFIGILLGIALATGTYFLVPTVYQWVTSSKRSISTEDSFKAGINLAMNAAELTQTAEFREDWSQVAILWQQAIGHMHSVPSSHPSYETAQQKLDEYARNFNYAKSNVGSRAPSNPGVRSYWTIGSDRELVFDIQGMPVRINQYDTTCREVLYYGDSVVELRNGYVAEYSDLDNNLDVLGNDKVALSVRADVDTWTIGSSQEEVFRVQGTPTRTSTYKDSVTLHYEDSYVELIDNQVVGYSNTDYNLKVSMIPIALPQEQQVPAAWDLGASRSEVLRIEKQTPTAVNRLDNSCEEIFTFENSTVTFRKGLVSEYSNSSENLSIQ